MEERVGGEICFWVVRTLYFSPYLLPGTGVLQCLFQKIGTGIQLVIVEVSSK